MDQESATSQMGHNRLMVVSRLAMTSPAADCMAGNTPCQVVVQQLLQRGAARVILMTGQRMHLYLAQSQSICSIRFPPY